MTLEEKSSHLRKKVIWSGTGGTQKLYHGYTNSMTTILVAFCMVVTPDLGSRNIVLIAIIRCCNHLMQSLQSFDVQCCKAMQAPFRYLQGILQPTLICSFQDNYEYFKLVFYSSALNLRNKVSVWSKYENASEESRSSTLHSSFALGSHIRWIGLAFNILS